MKPMRPSPIASVTFSDRIFSRLVNLCGTSVIPYCLDKCEETGRVDSFRLEWKEGKPHKPHIFWDSDFAKVIEGLALDCIIHPSDAKTAKLEKYVALIVSAQQPDGYLNTYFTQVEPDMRWHNLHSCHELYCAGHLMEAAVAHYQATGKRNFLDAMCRYADYIGTIFGTAKGQIPGYPGHEEIELALCKLADAADNPKYAELARYFVEQRGQSPNYFAQEMTRDGESFNEDTLRALQAHVPVREQKDAAGHAVRAMYLCCGMAEVAQRYDDAGLLKACETMFDSVTRRNMYVTGGIGASPLGECFTHDYDLPNTTAYAESCASIALALFAARMLNITRDAKYAETLETAIYNCIACGVSLSGHEYFYCNPLEVNGSIFSMRGNVMQTRQAWFNTSCCPTNYCRFLPQLGTLAVSAMPDGASVNIPAAAKVRIPLADARVLAFTLDGNYPFGNSFSITLDKACNDATIAFRIPAWARSPHVFLDGTELNPEPDKGYVTIRRDWAAGSRIKVTYTAGVRCLHADPRIHDDGGKFALAYGPVIFALESIDNGNDLGAIAIPEAQNFRLVPFSTLTPGAMAITGSAFREIAPDGALYSEAKPVRTPFNFTAIPFALWQNRGPALMRVWLRSL